MADDDDLEIVRAKYNKIRPSYERVVVEVADILRTKLDGVGIAPASIIGRAKNANSVLEKIGRKHYSDPLSQLTDLAGVRIVCAYTSELTEVEQIIESNFEVRERIDKLQELGTDRMGYQGKAYVVALGSRYAGGRYEGITNLSCEIQVRTILQDAWAIIDHQLVYKKENATPERLRRDLNNVASLLEIAQGMFDSVKEKRHSYVEEIQQKKQDPRAFLAQVLDFDTVMAYTKWKFPGLKPSEKLTQLLLRDIDLAEYPTLEKLDAAVNRARAAVDAYKAENPEWFKNGTDFITKSLGFVDAKFRTKHAFASKTRVAFSKYKNLVS